MKFLNYSIIKVIQRIPNKNNLFSFTNTCKDEIIIIIVIVIIIIIIIINLFIVDNKNTIKNIVSTNVALKTWLI